MTQKLDPPTYIYYTPKSLIQRKGCPCELTPTCQTSISRAEERRKQMYKFVTMRLLHQTKQGKIKNFLSLKNLHLELELESLKLQGSGSSNILLGKVSFDCLLKGKIQSVREYLSFDLRIPQANTEEQPVFSYEMIASMYGGKENLYEALKYFYILGRSCANPENHKHGHEPSYDPSVSKHDQYIRHTEQLLVAYLNSPEGTKMLCKRLRVEIRAKYLNVFSAKVYNMALHMHSTKTCCAPCEYALIGMMNSRTPYHQNERKLGFIPNFIQACSIPNEQLTFLLPKRSSFQLLVTLSASSADAHHKKQPEYNEQALKDQESVPNYDIMVKDSIVAKRIFTAMLNNSYDISRFSHYTSNLTDKTVAISGSSSTRNSQGGSSSTLKKVKDTKKSELDQLENSFHFLNLLSK